MEGPLPCARDPEGDSDPVGKYQRPSCGEPTVIRGTSSVYSTCGQVTGLLTVALEEGVTWEQLEREWREADEGTPLAWLHKR